MILRRVGVRGGGGGRLPLGNGIAYPPKGRTRDNCLLATKGFQRRLRSEIAVGMILHVGPLYRLLPIDSRCLFPPQQGIKRNNPVCQLS
jgi:hypothetical protein